MKKLMFVLILGLVLGLATTGLAAVTFDNAGNDGSLTAGSVMDDYRTSTNVSLIGLSAAASYSAVSSHLQGTRVFGSSSQSAQLFRLDAGKEAGVVYDTDPTNSDSSEFDSGWTAL